MQGFARGAFFAIILVAEMRASFILNWLEVACGMLREAVRGEWITEPLAAEVRQYTPAHPVVVGRLLSRLSPHKLRTRDKNARCPEPR